jgi:hypothetical protein
MRLDRIKIVEYDAAWAGRFEQQRARIEPLLADCLAAPIEHIGSTSVPGLPAKPIIDMVAVVDDYDACAEAFGPLAALGWLLAPEPGEAEARKWSLCYPSIERRTHHLHIFEASADALRLCWPSVTTCGVHPTTGPPMRRPSVNWPLPMMRTARHTEPARRRSSPPYLLGSKASVA